MKPEFLEILAHPLRQEILVFIEQEVETGYKDLKNKFNVATGTLYHHLRILKGLIEQNANKKYCLTLEGKLALDIIFQEKNPQNHNTQVISSPITEVPVENPIQDPNGLELKNSFFNINQFVNNIPLWAYQANFIAFFLLPIVLFLSQPQVIFFHFIPIEIHENLYTLTIVIFPLLNLLILYILSIIKKEKVSITTLGTLAIYFNIVFLITLLINVFQFYSSDFAIRLFSLLIQGLFIFFWTLSISLQYFSWEKSLFLAILQNYLFLLF